MKKFLHKSISLLLVLFSFYQIVFSLYSIFILYPSVLNTAAPVSYKLQASLADKAFIIYLNTIVNSIYGTLLLFKETEKVTIIHLIIGFALFIFSLVFITPTKLTLDPFNFIIRDLLSF